MTKNNSKVIQSTDTNSSVDIRNLSKHFSFREKFSKSLSLKNITRMVYFCQALSFFFGITAVAGVILNYLKRSEVTETWLEPHFTWQIRTFWIGLTSSFVGFILSAVLVGFLILATTLVWTIYRVIKGYLLLDAEKPIENSEAFL